MFNYVVMILYLILNFKKNTILDKVTLKRNPILTSGDLFEI